MENAPVFLLEDTERNYKIFFCTQYILSFRIYCSKIMKEFIFLYL